MKALNTFLDITENNVRRDYLEEGAFFPRNKDKDGRTLLIFKSKLHNKATKDFWELQRCVVYWFERLERLRFIFLRGSGQFA